ncbi:2',3'-cyclic-nucleotide 2'-phosphodiesterase/3'-nucleotidase [Rhodovulum bhavnagarense]|uniref:2',3'-cyclic-nucleotide 2'-phosphodiesterase/3'-nucleotidase n=1 Tax=Rhodovulum bhavnagarense TaxID=992286 RepID=A0A4R2RLW6_9RHOB|nr:bifunctional 2',3'-cyclic-nucleotide 2'-phosphodiesterase/3'-nucleotidase [Rhodovulum bhavnagarense]TCP60741.1 2',3'-cyclic-nucleotide 2'-phosphodiesterase/3'-nucleotidase [Rhodovulum bhavnagarense]
MAQAHISCAVRFNLSCRHADAGTAPGAPLIVPHRFTTLASKNQAHLRLMGTTDLHMHVFPYDYYADRCADGVGLARTAAHVDAIRAEAANAMLLDSGDFLQGNPMGDYIAYERGMREGDLHPVIAAMNAVGFDAATLGNHDFNYGLDFLVKSLAGARFPVLSANVVTGMGTTPYDDTHLVKPHIILERTLIDGTGKAHPFKVGLIGLAPPQITTWDRHYLKGRVRTRDIVETARAHVPLMKEKGADIIVALAHSGIGEPRHVEGQENACLPLATLEGIDAVMSGHQHLTFPGPAFAGIPGVDAERGTIHGKPAVMSGFWGSHLGVIDLMLERDAGHWRIVTHDCALRPISRRGKNREIAPLVESRAHVLNAAARAHVETLGYIRRPLGRTTAPLHSYFALVADDPSVQIVSNAQRDYMERMLKGGPHEHLPLLSAVAPFKTGGRGGPDHYTDIPAGRLALRHLADLYPYPNTVRALRVSGAQLKGWLERSAGIFNQITPGGTDQELLNPAFPGYNFDVIDGVRYQIEISQPSRFDIEGNIVNPGASRIVALTWQGRPVSDDMEFVIVTNNYRADGGGAFPGTGCDTAIVKSPTTIRDVILRHVVETSPLTPGADGNWRLAPLPGTTVLFDTSPQAAHHATRVLGLAIEPAGEGAGGFARFRLRL